MKVQIPPPPGPATAEVDMTVRVRFQFNITPFIALQTVNAYLLMNVGHMVSADEPTTMLLNDGAFWKVPVFCAYPDLGHREYLGGLLVDAESGIVMLQGSSFSSPEEIADRAEERYRSLTAPATGT